MAARDFALEKESQQHKQQRPRGAMRNLLQRGAKSWQLSPAAILFIVILPFLLLGIGASAALFGKATYLWLTGEDAMAENIQVVLFGLTFFLSLWVAQRYWQANYKLIAILYLFLAIGLFFLTGEEISWGQRIFGWQTNGVMAEINTQNETNIHNISGFKTAFKWVQLLVGAYGLFLPLLLKRWKARGPWRDLLTAIVPHPVLMPYFGTMFFWKVYRNLFVVSAQWEFVMAEYNEILELVLAIGLFLFMIFQLRHKKLT